MKQMPLLSLIYVILFFACSNASMIEKYYLANYEQRWSKLNSDIVQAYSKGQNKKGVKLVEKAYQYALLGTRKK